MEEDMSSNENKNWLIKQPSGHMVLFYNNDDELINPLSEFISSGLRQGEVYLVIATCTNVAKLNFKLNELLIDTTKETRKGIYVVIEAEKMLNRFMLNGLPNKKLFFETFSRALNALRDNYPYKSRKIRVYGEMVAVLWSKGNSRGMLQLEKLWNELALRQSFSFFCGYPKDSFIYNNHLIEKINICHDNQLKPAAKA